MGILAAFYSTSHAETLSLSQFQQLLQQQHPFFKKEKLNEEISNKRLESIKAGESWVLHSTPSYFHDEPVSSSVFSSEEANTVGINIGLMRPVWKSGGNFQANWIYNYTDQDSSRIPTTNGEGFLSAFPEFHQHALMLNYIQPLLKNRGGGQNRLAADLQYIQSQIERINALEAKEDFLLESSNIYLSWVLQTEQVNIQQGRVALAKEQLAKSEEQARDNLIDEADVLRSTDAMLKAEQALLSLNSAKRSSASQLTTLTGGSLDMNKLEPDFFLGDMRMPNKLDQLKERIISSSRLIQLVELSSEITTRQLKSILDDLRPQLNLEVGAGVKSGAEQQDDAFELDRNEYRAALVFSHPLGGKSSKADREAARLSLKQASLETEVIKRNLKRSIDSLVIQLSELMKIIESNEKQIHAAQKRSAAEKKSYEEGRSALNFVIQARDSEASAEASLVQSKVQFQQILLQLRALEDRLLPE